MRKPQIQKWVSIMKHENHTHTSLLYAPLALLALTPPPLPHSLTSLPSQSRRYSGWFKLVQADGSTVEVKENDVSFKLIKNSAGYWNVDGRGRNAYGMFTLTGTLDKAHNLELYKHFNARVSKPKKGPAAPASSLSLSPAGAPQQAAGAPQQAAGAPQQALALAVAETPTFAPCTLDEIELAAGMPPVEVSARSERGGGRRGSGFCDDMIYDI